MKYQDLKNGRFYWEDCFDAMKEIPNGVVDMILCDLPYGTTQNKWDSVLPRAGSGTTAIAAINTKRRWICIEKEEEYANKAIERIIAHK